MGGLGAEVYRYQYRKCGGGGGTLVMTPSIEGKAESWAAFLLAPPGVYRGS